MWLRGGLGIVVNLVRVVEACTTEGKGVGGDGLAEMGFFVLKRE